MTTKMNISQSLTNPFMSELSSLCNSSNIIVKSEDSNKMATLAIPNVLDFSVKNKNLQEMASQRRPDEFDIIHDETVEVITFQSRPDEFYIIHDENVEIITFQRGANVLGITKNENLEEMTFQRRPNELDITNSEHFEEIKSQSRTSLLDFSITTENVEEITFRRHPSELGIVTNENLEECLLQPSDAAENTNNANMSSDTSNRESAHKMASISSKLTVSNHENRENVNRKGTKFAYEDVYTSRSDCVDGIPSSNCESLPIENQSKYKSGKLNQPSYMVSTRPGAKAIDHGPVDMHWTRSKLLYNCNICDKTYRRLDKMRDHIRMHLGIRPYACSKDGCKKTFTTLYSLNSHVKEVHRPRAFACSGHAQGIFCITKNENLEEMTFQRRPNELDITNSEHFEEIKSQSRTRLLDFSITTENVEEITFQRHLSELGIVTNENLEECLLQPSDAAENTNNANMSSDTSNRESAHKMASISSKLTVSNHENRENVNRKGTIFAYEDVYTSRSNCVDGIPSSYCESLPIKSQSNKSGKLNQPSYMVSENTNNANMSSDTSNRESAHKMASISSKLTVSNHENRENVNRKGTKFAYEDVYTSRSDCVDGIPSSNCESLPIENQSNKSGKLNQPSYMVSTRPDAKAIDHGPVDMHWTRSKSLYNCNICDKTYRRLDKMRDHIRTHLDIRPYACSEDGCKKKFTTLYCLNSHVKKIHRPRAFACSKCDKTFSSIYELKCHEGYHSNVKPYKCNECGKHFYTNPQLKIHMSVHQKKKEQCEICGSLIQQGGMSNHINSVHLKKRIKCDVCAYTSLSLFRMREHGRVHGDGDLLTCDVCSRTFVHKNQLTQHMSTHSHLSFPCTKCDRTFRTKHRRDDHLGEHEGIKKYYCKVCGKRFTYSHYLCTHMKSHGLKKFVCDICGGKFNRNDNLKSHVLRHETSERKKLKKTVANVG